MSRTASGARAAGAYPFMLAFWLACALLAGQTAAAQTTPILAYDLYGHGPEKVVVLHSWFGNAHSFDHVKPYLDADAFTFAFVDLRGYGRSRHIAGAYTSGEAAQDALRLADALGWHRFHVIGHSMSGMIAQRLAVDDWKSGDRRLESVIAVTPVTADGYPADGETRAFLESVIHDLERSKELVSALTGARLGPIFGRIAATRNLSTSRPDAMMGYYEMWIDGDFAAEAEAARVGTPMRVIGGRQDLPGFQEEHYRKTFLAWYPNVELHFIDDAGHFPMVETPVYFAALLDTLLRSNSDS